MLRLEKAPTAETRARMQRIRQRDTQPELLVRRILAQLGIRYRTNVRSLAGTPDLAHQGAKWAIFVHGCYWHGHEGCRLYTIPKTNRRFWQEKIRVNRRRDARKARALRRSGFRVITVWQCETRNAERLANRLSRLLVARQSIEMGDSDASFLRLSRPMARGRERLSIVDLFSGCGGLTLGVAEAARQYGYATKVLLAVEKDEAIAAIYARNFSPQFGLGGNDVRDWFGNEAPGKRFTFVERQTRRHMGSVDLLLAGPPCQGHSSLNNHTRNDDPKNGLYSYVVRAAEVLEATGVIIENVPAIERDARKALDSAIHRLTSVGYKIDHGVVTALNVGVPQSRERHVLVAHIHAQPNLEMALNAASVPRRSVQWAIADLLDVASEDFIDAPSVLSGMNERRARYLLDNDLYDLPNRLRPPCQRDDHKYKSMYGRLRWNAPAQTITTGFGSPGQGRYLHSKRARALTPHEAARIQSFPDWFDFGDAQSKRELALAIGNAVPPKLAFVLGHHLVGLGVRARASLSLRPRLVAR